MKISRPFLASFVINSAVLALVLGAAGIVDIFFRHSAFLPLLTIFASLPGIVIGSAFMAFIFNHPKVIRLCGALLMAYALLLWSVDLSQYSSQFNQPPFLMTLNLIFIGGVFAIYRLFRYYWIAGLAVVIYGVVLGTTEIANIWSAQSGQQAVTNAFEISIFALMILIVPLAMLAAHSASGYDIKSKLVENWFPIFAIQIITVSLWVYLSSERIEEIYRQGEMSITQTGEAIDGAIHYYSDAGDRVYGRIASAPQDQVVRVAREEASRLWSDFPMIDSVTLVKGGDFRWSTGSKTDEDYSHLRGPEYTAWIEEPGSNISFSADMNTNSPKVIMGIKMDNTVPDLMLLAHIDLTQALAILPESRFDVFSKAIQISEESFIGIGSSFRNTDNAKPLIDRTSVVLSTAYELPTGSVLTIYALLTAPEVLLTPVRMHLAVLFAGFIFSIVLTYTFITNARLRRQRSELKQIAIQDSVTDLYRRNFLEEKIQHHITSSAVAGHVLFVDLDGFKPINDSWGLEIGNRVLNIIASRLSALADNRTWVSRFSSDEFIVFIEPHTQFDLSAYSQQILKSIRQKILIEEFPIYLTASIGVYQLDSTVTNADQAIQRADVAMSAAKEFGGNTYRIYTDDMTAHYQRALTLRNQLQAALDEEALEVFYQPLVNALTGITESVEALVRWPKADGTYTPPALFIPIAERTGQIFQLSEFVMQRALRDIADLSTSANINVSINLSLQQFYQADFLNNIDTIVSTAGFDRTKLYFELTESIFAKDAQFITAQLTALREQGIKIAIDDFGTGYSSLSTINRLPFDIIKIDKSFTAEIQDASQSNPLVETVINMSHSLDKLVVVEGIETEAQRDYFIGKGCYTHQGYYYSRPLSIAQLRSFLAKHNAAGHTE